MEPKKKELHYFSTVKSCKNKSATVFINNKQHYTFTVLYFYSSQRMTPILSLFYFPVPSNCSVSSPAEQKCAGTRFCTTVSCTDYTSCKHMYNSLSTKSQEVKGKIPATIHRSQQRNPPPNWKEDRSCLVTREQI
jgi:hypothetical protein